jgi:hypothetical protein
MMREDNIKEIFVPFLKDFYKYRYEYRPDTVAATFDARSAGGLLADGMLTFRQQNDQPFVCTYEATSRDKVEEVKYSLNLPYFLWDCAAFAGILTAVMYTILFIGRLPWLIGLQVTGNLGLLLGLLLPGFLGWYFVMSGWRKYRYIYAIEQFKRYFADEQWVALAEDVFPAPTDPYLLELKDQCIFNGFGLALVQSDGQVRPLATPSRLGIYGKDRKMAHWFTQQQWYQAFAKNAAFVGHIQPKLPGFWQKTRNYVVRSWQFLVVAPLQKIFGQRIDESNTSTDRFMRAQLVQKWVFGLTMALNLYLFSEVLKRRDPETAAVEDVLTWRGADNPEDQPTFYQPGDPVPYTDGLAKQYPMPVEPEIEVQTVTTGSTTDEEDGPTIDLSGGDDDQKITTPATTAPKTAATPRAPGNCPPRGWLIQDGSYTGRPYAEGRLKALRQRGLKGGSMPRACLEQGKDGYLVYLEAGLRDEKTARAKAANYAKALDRYGLTEGALLVRKVP